MNVITQQQRNNAVHISGLIRNFKTINTRTGKPMAVFTIGTTPAKCFDLTVDNVKRWADMDKQVQLIGNFSNHHGQIELVAQNVFPAPASSTHVQRDFQLGDCAEVSTANPSSIRETSETIENLCGSVCDIKTITTRSGRPMITFRIGSAGCKVFGDLAGVIQKSGGMQIEVSARKGMYRGSNEYAIETIKGINGVSADRRDGRTTSTGQHINKTVQTAEAKNQQAEIEEHELFLQREIESDRWIHKVETPPIHNQQDQPALTSGVAPLQRTPTSVDTEPKDEASRAELIETAKQSMNSVKLLPELEGLVDQWVRRFKHSSFPDHELEDKLKFGDPFVREAARRVLEERAKQRAEDNLQMAARF